MSAPGAADGHALGVLVPCRNEAAVIERKLQNLARSVWPAAGRPHRVVVVDDGSDDGTGALATEICARLFDAREVRAECVPNQVRPGKNGALTEGIGRLEGAVDLIVVSDADVVLDPLALVQLRQAFAEDERLGMACGAQRLVRALAVDGRCLSPEGAAPEPAADGWDRVTAHVRALESLFGALFSVHGQLLAWRAELGLRPTPGVAADDLDLMLCLRERRPQLGVRRVSRAAFYEVKTPAGARGAQQALRRARAYLQLFRAHPRPPRAGWPARLQWTAYRLAPAGVVALGLVPPVAVAVLLTLWFARVVPRLDLGPALAGSALVALGAAWLWRVSAGGVHLAWTVLRAMRLERRGSLPERWEMQRS